jgi:alpha-L-fucosidase 2
MSPTEAEMSREITLHAEPAKRKHFTIFQIDGKIGIAAAIAEMLLQSHGEIIAILSAWPDAGKTGAVEGLRARGGVELDIASKETKDIIVKLEADRSGEHRLQLPSGRGCAWCAEA